MHPSFKYIVLFLLAALVVFILIDTLRFYVLIRKGRVLAKNAIPFNRSVPHASMTILVLGDSTAVGTGSESAQLSTAGRMGTLYPGATIENISVNGLKLAGLLQILEKIGTIKHYDIILVQIGANDIIRLTKKEDIKRDAEKVFAELSQHTNKLIVLHSGDVGEAKIFPLYARFILSQKSFEMRDIYKNLSAKYNARYVDLINSPSRKLLRDNPSVYYAADFLHLNGAGYGLWFDEIQKALN